MRHFAEVFAESDGSRWLIDNVRTGAYSNPRARLSVWAEAMRHIGEQARDMRINREYPDFYTSLLDRAIAAGFGDEDIAALYKVLKLNEV